MSSVINLQRRVHLESERDEVLRNLRKTKDYKDRRDLMDVLVRIGQDLATCGPIATEVTETETSPILPDSHYSEAMPSRRIHTRSSRNEGAPSPKKKIST
jgi:hypothetical protein